ncbi:MAG: hypothetical protein Fur0022_47850 [Anaerolineales bacterium]
MRYFRWMIWIWLLVGCSSPQETVTAPTPVATVQALPPTEIPSPTPMLTTPDAFIRETIDLESVELRSLPDQPGVVLIHVTGLLPTPCHQAASVVCPSCVANSPKLIDVSLYALIEKGRTCRGPTTPFEQDVPLGVFTEGVYIVQLNGQYVGQFDAASFGREIPMERDAVFLESISLVPPAGENLQAKAILKGYLPTPCHVFDAEVEVGAQGEIMVEAFSMVQTGVNCLDVVQDFTAEVPLGALASGTYPVWVNGESAGVLEVP